MKYPARKPDNIPPKKPVPPVLAIKPPTKPTTKPGRLAIPSAIYADKIGTIMPIEASLILFNIAAVALY